MAPHGYRVRPHGDVPLGAVTGTCTHLEIGGLVFSPFNGRYQITQRGLRVARVLAGG